MTRWLAVGSYAPATTTAWIIFVGLCIALIVSRYAINRFFTNRHAARQGPLFTVTNPPGTVSVTTYLNGRVQHVGLSPGATKMTEAQLAQEILVVADVAAVKARAALHTFVAGLLRLQGLYSQSARDFVEHRLSLPTPEQASAAEGEFAARYAHDVE